MNVVAFVLISTGTLVLVCQSERTPIIRDSKFTCMLRYLNEQIIVQEVNKCKGVIPSGLNKKEDSLCKEWGIYGYWNVNYMIGLQLEKRGVTSFHQMYPPDNLTCYS